MASPSVGGVEALRRLKSIDPPLLLSPSPELSQAARAASQHLFSSLQPFCPKSPFDRLLIQGFDAEQIWQQIDLQTQPLVYSLRRELKEFKKNPEEIKKLFGGDVTERVVAEKSQDFGDDVGGGEGSEDFEDLEDEENGGFDDEDDEEDEAEDEEEEGGEGGIEDRFLKIKELEEYMEEDEERQYGGGSKRKGGGSKSGNDEEEEDDGEDEDDDMEGLQDSGSEDEDINARYEDFFGGKKGQSSKRKQRPLLNEAKDLNKDNEEASEDFEEDSNEDDDAKELENERDEGFIGRKNRAGDLSKDKEEDYEGLDQPEERLSTHEKQIEKLRLKIQQMEKANLEPKAWTMQGEVTAAKRPKNSALEVDLDFEHNVRPAPVITEEVTTSLEDLIKKRILDGHFDDVRRVPGLPSKGPKEIKELDENKSKKGLAEIYEEEFTQKKGLASAPLSFSDELKKEASLLFKKICLKLDALSHFHFTPKPIIEDMSIQANVPALAMEEIAPLAVSDAAMLAPEEVFAGKGDIKEEAELTQAERKRRRASKKRKFKAERTKVIEKKSLDNAINKGKEES